MSKTNIETNSNEYREILQRVLLGCTEVMLTGVNGHTH
jgi:hypothetical protein